MKLLIINGPNMNLLSVREPSVYGNKSYEDLVEYLRRERGQGSDADAATGCHELDFIQTNHEGVIIDELHRAYYEGYDGVVLNPGGYSHTSIAIMDAIAAIPTPVAVVHISNPLEREDFRHTDYAAMAADYVVKGHGFGGYVEAVDLLAEEH